MSDNINLNFMERGEKKVFFSTVDTIQRKTFPELAEY